MSELTCVRCGQEPRDGDAFVGIECRTNEAMRRELEEAVPSLSEGSVKDQRQYLVDHFGWAGGWSQRRGHAALTASSSEQPPA